MKKIIELNGIWDFVADLDPKYHAIHGGFHKPGVNRRHWQKVTVPGVWQKYGERYSIFEGVCWFAREFEAPEFSEAAKALLRFSGVNYIANVYLNGEFVGSHEGGYTEFSIDVSNRIKPGSNSLAVQVDNRSLVTRMPPCLGYFNYGGIHRDVALEIFEGAAFNNVGLTAARDDKGWVLGVRASIHGFKPGLSVRISNGGKIVREKNINGKSIDIKVPFPEAPSWTPEDPHLEAIRIELLAPNCKLVDEYDFNFGFRLVSLRDQRIHLNGEAYHLKGICHVYDNELTGLVMTTEQIEQDLGLIKELGCNSVRCHYPMDDAFYAACDRIGLLVWIEPPVYCYHPADDAENTCFSDPEWLDLACRMAVEMIAVARNHPSVIIYSIGNECNTNNPEAEGFFRALAAAIRQEDPSRLISYAALYGIVKSITDIVDVLGINSYWGWYDKIWGGKGLAPKSGDMEMEAIDLAPMREMLDKVLAEKQDMALLLTEFGADSVPGNYSQSREMWSENYHADLLTEIIELAKEYPQINGTFPFCFTDYRDPSKVHNGYWNEINLKGVVDYRRNKKMAFDSLKKSYDKKNVQTRN
jgi:beta-glucuronidase